MALSMLFAITGCKKEDDTKIPEDCVAGKLSFDFETDAGTAYETALNLLYHIDKTTNLTALSPLDDRIALTNDVNAQKNPYEDLTYMCTETERELKYRYMCKNDFSVIDTKYVMSVANELFGVDLSEYPFEQLIEEMKTEVVKIDAEQIIPTMISHPSGVSIIVSGTHTKGDFIITVMMSYGVAQIVHN
jgi:hypothetical protein